MGGVILRTEDGSGRREWEERLGLAPHELTERVFEGEMSRRASVGKASTEQIWADLAAEFDLTPTQRHQLEKDFWRGDRVDRQLLSYIRALRPQRRTALLSNAWPDVRQHIEERWQFADAFDRIVISAEVGMVKPDPRIYQLTLEQLAVEPAQAVFIDDFPLNVRGAREVGMHAIRFHSPEQVRRELDELLDSAAVSEA